MEVVPPRSRPVNRHRHLGSEVLGADRSLDRKRRPIGKLQLRFRVEATRCDDRDEAAEENTENVRT